MIVDTSAIIAVLLDEPERDRLIDAMLDGLSGKTREAFLLSQLEGLTYSDIAQKLGVSASSVKKYVARAVEHCLLFRLEHGL